MKKLLLIALIGGGLIATANAEIYVQGDLGYSKIKTSGLDSDNFSGSSLSPSIAVGYKMGDWRAALDYTYYGKADSNYSYVDTTGYSRVKAQGIGFSLLYDFDLNSAFKPYAGVRIASNKITSEDTYTEKNKSTVREKESLTKFGYGGVLGVNYGLTSNLDLNTALEYNRLGSEDGVKVNQYGVKVGLRYTF